MSNITLAPNLEFKIAIFHVPYLKIEHECSDIFFMHVMHFFPDSTNLIYIFVSGLRLSGPLNKQNNVLYLNIDNGSLGSNSIPF